MVTNNRILVAEDEIFIALDLSFAIEDACGQVVGPVSSVKDALLLIDEKSVEGAILDVNLVDGDIAPVLARLIANGTPLIIQTGLGLPPALAARFPNLTVHTKPSNSTVIVEQLMAMIAARKSLKPASGSSASSPTTA